MKTPAPSSKIDEILSELGGLTALRIQSYCEQPLHREISLQQLHILMTVREHGSMTVSDLAHRLEMSISAASSILDRMEERQLLTRIRPQTDRRVVTVEMSRHGRDVTDEFIGLKRGHLQRILGAMTEGELDDTLSGVRALRSALLRLQSPPAEISEMAPAPATSVGV